jgi:hypothetical protein
MRYVRKSLFCIETESVAREHQLTSCPQLVAGCTAESVTLSRSDGVGVGGEREKRYVSTS